VFNAFGQSTTSNQGYGVVVSKKLPFGTELRGSLDAAAFRNQLGDYYNSDATLQITQPLFRGFGAGGPLRFVRDAESAIGDASHRLHQAETLLALDVASAYYAVAVQTSLLKVAQAARDRANALRDASAALLETGRVSQLDVLRARQQAGQTEARVLDAADGLADAEDRLNMLIGRRPGQRLSVVVPEPAPGPQVNVEEALETALTHRSEVTVADEAVVVQMRAVSAARNQLLPRVDLGVAVTRRATASSLGASLGLYDFEPAAFASVSMPLDRTGESVALQSAILEQERRERERDVIRDRVTVDVRQAVRRLARSETTRQLARTSVELAEREVEVAAFRYQRGLSNNLDLVSAHNTLQESQAQEIAAQAEIALARLALLAATGRLDPRKDVR
jgi:outer membrane protein TolC